MGGFGGFYFIETNHNNSHKIRGWVRKKKTQSCFWNTIVDSRTVQIYSGESGDPAWTMVSWKKKSVFEHLLGFSSESPIKFHLRVLRWVFWVSLCIPVGRRQFVHWTVFSSKHREEFEEGRAPWCIALWTTGVTASVYPIFTCVFIPWNTCDLQMQRSWKVLLFSRKRTVITKTSLPAQVLIPSRFAPPSVPPMIFSKKCNSH